MVDSVRPSVGVCPDLAYTFRLVAERRDRRTPKAVQRRIARQSLETPFVTDYDRALADWYRVIDLVYDAEALSPPEIERSVLEHCGVDANGRAVVNAPWDPPDGH